MLFDPKCDILFGRLERQLRDADGITAELFADVIDQTGASGATRDQAAQARIKSLVASGAWTDAALALVELAAPHWKPRRLICDEGEWHCALSSDIRLPTGLDEVSEAHHHVLALAILLAFVQVRGAGVVAADVASVVPRVRAVSGQAVCCDNFS